MLYLEHNFSFIYHAIPWLFTPQIFYHHALFLVIITALMLIITISLRDYHSSISGLSQLYNWFISALWPGYHSSITGLSQLYNRLITALSQGCNFCRVLHRLLIVYYSACVSTVMLLSTIIKISCTFL